MMGCSKTHIMYRANLSYPQLNEYLSFLLEVKLLTHTMQDNRKIYSVTPKGKRFLQNYVKIKDLLKTDEEREDKNNSLNYFKDGNCYKTRE
jgi:predicted transcriptional regulator